MRSCYRGCLAYFIADVQSYSYLKIVAFFPIYRKKFLVKSYKIKKFKWKFLKSLKSKATSLLQYLNDDWCHPRQLFLNVFVNHCKNDVLYILPINNKTQLKFPILWVWVCFWNTGKNPSVKISRINQCMVKIVFCAWKKFRRAGL